MSNRSGTKPRQVQKLSGPVLRRYMEPFYSAIDTLCPERLLQEMW